MVAKKYLNPIGFKQALEHRIKQGHRGQGGAALQRKRQLLIFERFLARIFGHLGDQIILKGGMVLELRLERARSTKDLDFRLLGSPDGLLDQLKKAGSLELGDHMQFECREDPRHPTIEGEGVLYEGRRYRAQCFLAGKEYGVPFGLDASFADAIVGVVEELPGSDFFEFAELEPVVCRVYPLTSHIAEKLHAYTLPRQRENSRLKDLPDLGLLASCRTIDSESLREAIELTFSRRATHQVPAALPQPPTSWGALYEAMADEEDLPWETLAILYQTIEAFLNPVLAGEDGTWDPEIWGWQTGA